MQTMRIISIALVLVVAGCSTQMRKATVQVPEILKPGPSEVLALIVRAKGEQIYECRAKQGQPGAYEWTFVAPEAELFDEAGRKIGRHYAGPHWESADGSKIVGTVKQRAEAPAGDIPWLLLAAKSVGPEGAFSKVTSIQRVSTLGGAAPPGGCAQAGVKAHVRYTADYYFYTSK